MFLHATASVGYNWLARLRNERVLDYSGHGLDGNDMLALAAGITESQVRFVGPKLAQLKTNDGMFQWIFISLVCVCVCVCLCQMDVSFDSLHWSRTQFLGTTLSLGWCCPGIPSMIVAWRH
jgi:hypothetical protein